MQIVFATHNPNKIKEVAPLLPKNLHLLSLTDIGCFQEIPETGNTLEKNALIKAQYVVDQYGYPSFADDTGLLVDALNGAPGVYSARYAGLERDTNANMEKLLTELGTKMNRSARFKTVIALCFQGSQHLFSGTVEGEITSKKIGSGGFGYDPIFKPLGFNQTFGELSRSIKSEIGHRGKAIRKLVDHLEKMI